jgi:hypothetical protein
MAPSPTPLLPSSQEALSVLFDALRRSAKLLSRKRLAARRACVPRRPPVFWQSARRRRLVSLAARFATSALARYPSRLACARKWVSAFGCAGRLPFFAPESRTCPGRDVRESSLDLRLAQLASRNVNRWHLHTCGLAGLLSRPAPGPAPSPNRPLAQRHRRLLPLRSHCLP